MCTGSTFSPVNGGRIAGPRSGPGTRRVWGCGEAGRHDASGGCGWSRGIKVGTRAWGFPACPIYFFPEEGGAGLGKPTASNSCTAPPAPLVSPLHLGDSKPLLHTYLHQGGLKEPVLSAVWEFKRLLIRSSEKLEFVSSVRTLVGGRRSSSGPAEFKFLLQRGAFLITRVIAPGFLHESILPTRSFSSLAYISVSLGQLRIPLPALSGQVLTLGLSPVISGLLRSYCTCPQKLDRKEDGAMSLWSAVTVGLVFSVSPHHPQGIQGESRAVHGVCCGMRRFLAVGLKVCVGVRPVNRTQANHHHHQEHS